MQMAEGGRAAGREAAGDGDGLVRHGKRLVSAPHPRERDAEVRQGVDETGLVGHGVAPREPTPHVHRLLSDGDRLFPLAQVRVELAEAGQHTREGGRVGVR
nr:hypothetical protein [Streptomyces triticiradicis]